MSTLAILGSSRGDGHTAQVLAAVTADLPAETLDLGDYHLEHYRYEAEKPVDDFPQISEKLGSAKLILLATPVYWYSMSGRMKVFFDRLTDLVTVEKKLGRSLAGKRLASVTTSSEPQLPEGFIVPFRESCAYLDMSYLGNFHGSFPNDVPEPGTLAAARAFGRSLLRRCGPRC